MLNWMQRAREASGLSQEQCAVALCMPLATYISRENAPGTFTLDEVSALSAVMNAAACSIISEALAQVALK